MGVILSAIADSFHHTPEDGGAIGFVLRTLSAGSEWSFDHIKDEYANPEQTTYMALTVVCLLLAVLLLVGNFVLCCACRCSRFCTKGRRKIKEGSTQHTETLSIVVIIALFLLSLCSILLVAYTVAYNHQFSSTYNKTASEKEDSIMNNYNVITAKILNYISSVERKCDKRLSPLVNTTMNETMTLVSESISSFIDELLLRYSVTQVIEVANKLFRDLNLVLDTMKEVKHFKDVTRPLLDEFSGVIENYKNDVLQSWQVCGRMSQRTSFAKGMECSRLMDYTRDMKVGVDASKIDLEGGPSLIYMLDKMNINFTKFEKDYTNGINTMFEKLAEVQQSVINFPLQEATESIQGICQMLKNVTEMLDMKMGDIETGIEDNSKKYINICNAVFIVLIVGFIACVIVVGRVSMRPMFKNMGNTCQPKKQHTVARKKPNSQCYSNSVSTIRTSGSQSSVGNRLAMYNNSTTNLGQDNLAGANDDNNNYKEDRPSSTLSRGSATTLWRQSETSSITRESRESNRHKAERTISWSVPHAGAAVGVFFFIISVVMFAPGYFLQTQVCHYLKNQDNMQLIDTDLNLFLQPMLKRMLKDIQSSDGNYRIKVGEITIPLNINLPNNVLKLVTQDCKDESKSIFQLLQLQNVVNVTGFIYSDGFQDILKEGKTAAKKAITDLDVTKIIPSGLSGMLKQAQDITKVFVDEINYRESIEELKKPLISSTRSFTEFSEFEKYLNKFAQLIEEYLRDNSVDIDAHIIKRRIDSMRTWVATTKQFRKDFDNLTKAFTILQNTRQITNTTIRVSKQMTEALKKLKDKNFTIGQIDEVFAELTPKILKNIAALLENSVKKIVAEMVGCEPISAIFDLTNKTMCEMLIPLWFDLTFWMMMSSICLLAAAVVAWLLYWRTAWTTLWTTPGPRDDSSAAVDSYSQGSFPSTQNLIPSMPDSELTSSEV